MMSSTSSSNTLESIYESAIKSDLSKRAQLHLKWLGILSLIIQLVSTFWTINIKVDGLILWLLFDILLGSVVTFGGLFILYYTMMTELKNEQNSSPMRPVGISDVLRIPSIQTWAAFVTSSFLLGLRGLWTTSRYAAFNKHYILYPEGRYGDQEPNENLAFTFMYQLLLGCSYAWYRTISEKDKLVFPLVKRSLWFRLKSRLFATGKHATYLSFISLMSYLILYLIFGRQIYSLAGLVFKWMFWTKISKLRTFRLTYFDTSLLFHTFVNGLIVIWAWEWNDQLLIAIWTEIPSTCKSTDPYGALFAGLKSQKSYYQHLAYAELSDMIRHDPIRRADVYNDVVGASGGKGATWLLLQSACQSTLEELNISIANFGLAKAPSKMTQPPSAQEASMRRAQPVDQSILLPRKATAVDTFLTSLTRDSLQKRPSATTAAITTSGFNETPFWLRNNPTDVAPILDGTAAISLTPSALMASQTRESKTLVDIIWPYVISTQQTIAQHPKLSKIWDKISSQKSVKFSPSAAKAKQLYRKFQIYIWSAEALAYVMVHSRKEDQYGIVANDLHPVLDSVLKALDSIEKYISNVKLMGLASQEGMCPWEVNSIASALRAFVYAIVEAYYQYLQNYNFSPLSSKKLAEFITFAA